MNQQSPLFSAVRFQGTVQQFMSILADVKEQIGDAPIYHNDAGEVFVHPLLLERLKQPGNEEIFQCFLYMKDHLPREDN